MYLVNMLKHSALNNGWRDFAIEDKNHLKLISVTED